MTESKMGTVHGIDVAVCSRTQQRCTSISPIEHQSHVRRLHFWGGPLDPISWGDVSSTNDIKIKGNYTNFFFLPSFCSFFFFFFFLLSESLSPLLSVL